MSVAIGGSLAAGSHRRCNPFDLMKIRMWITIVWLLTTASQCRSQVTTNSPSTNALHFIGVPKASETNAIAGAQIEVRVLPKSSIYSNVVARADEALQKGRQKWGTPEDVRWRLAPLNRYAVYYATPKQ
jgi:hypothetical protein